MDFKKDTSENYSTDKDRLFNQLAKALIRLKEINGFTEKMRRDEIPPLKLEYMIDDYDEFLGQANSLCNTV